MSRQALRVNTRKSSKQSQSRFAILTSDNHDADECTETRKDGKKHLIISG